MKIMSGIYPEISGAILARTNSRRLGYRKPFLKAGGQTLIGRVLKIMRRFFDEILVVTDNTALFSGIGGVLAVQDLISGRGPLGGIYTGLKESSKEKVFFAGCDMPFLHVGLIDRILSATREGRFECIIPYGPRGIEPLHGVYSKATLGVIENLLREEDFAIRRIFPRVSTKFIEAEPDELISFSNINTPEDLVQLRRGESDPVDRRMVNFPGLCWKIL